MQERATEPVISLADWASINLRAGERELMAGFVMVMKLAKVLAAPASFFEREYERFKKS